MAAFLTSLCDVCVTGTLDAHAHSSYIIVYLHTTLSPENEPSFAWLRKVYDLFDQVRDLPYLALCRISPDLPHLARSPVSRPIRRLP